MLLKISQVYLFENRVAHRKNPSCYQYPNVTGWGTQGRLWTSTLTEPVKLATYFKNGNAVTGGSA